MNAIHLKCERAPQGGLINLSFDKASGTYRSGFWNLSVEDAQRLVGGWIYLHQAKTVASQFGGMVLEFEQVQREELARKDRIVLVVAASLAGRGQAWRGKRHEMAWTGGLVEASLPHEQEAAAAM
ncbi:hypothetical protein [Geminicoccus roseus]|uniref:hypothetical protein n=1 Tax=Geminicoccus roseus TaxID=404900 RepID=UPI000411E98A|nr:hypothetical protein [Geminicoccus roseus]